MGSWLSGRTLESLQGLQSRGPVVESQQRRSPMSSLGIREDVGCSMKSPLMWIPGPVLGEVLLRNACVLPHAESSPGRDYEARTQFLRRN